MTVKKDQTVLITGASSGIGAAFVEVFAKEGYDLVLVARKKDQLLVTKQRVEALYSTDIFIITQDLAEEGAAQRIHDELSARNITIDILVNNAGLGSFGAFAQEDIIREREMLMVNIVAVTQLTRLILPGMISRNKGKILNVASIASFVPGPLMSVYFASKAYVLSFSEGLREEVREAGVAVTALCPGPTKTAFFDHEGGVQSKKFRDPLLVARYGYTALMRGARVALPDKKYVFLFFLQRFIPRWLVIRIVARMI